DVDHARRGRDRLGSLAVQPAVGAAVMLPYGETVTILSRVQTGVDRYGNPVYEWPGPGVDVAGCGASRRTPEGPAGANRTTGVDRDGNPVYEWPGPGVDAAGCGVAPRTSEELAEVNRNRVITGLTVYLAPGTQNAPHDRLVVRGATYEVVGEPGDWRSPYSG